MANKYLISVLIVLGIIVLIDIFEGTITGSLVKESEEKIVIYMHPNKDFLNDEQGTMIFRFRFSDGTFRVGDKTADMVMFLNSEVIRGLRAGYNTKEKTIYAGMPLLSSGEVDITDSNLHELAYSFNKNVGRQRIMLDGNVLAEGEFTGKVETDFLTGYSIKENVRWVEGSFDMEVEVE